MFNRLGRICVDYPWAICAGWLVLAIAITAVAPDWRRQAQDDDIRFLPAKYASVRGFQLLEKSFPQDVYASRATLAFDRADAPLGPDDYALVDRVSAGLTALSREQPELQITGVISHREPLIGRRLTSADKHCTLVQISLGTPYLATQTRDSMDAAEARAREILKEAGAGAPALYVTGPAAIGHDLVTASANSLSATTFATIALVVIVLLCVYRSPLLALIPLVTIGVATWVALQLLALVTLIPGVHLVNISQVFAIVLIFGAGTDYCLFLIARYREGLEEGDGKRPALRASVRTVGGALAASAATVVVGLGMMGTAEFGKIRCAGPVIALGLGVALVASLTLTPALLAIVGYAAFWPRRVGHSSGLPIGWSPESRLGLWERLSRLVVKRPITVFASTLMILTPLALLGLRVSPTFRPTGDLSPSSGSIRGMEKVQKRFPAGETGPLTVLLVSKEDWNSPHGRETIDFLSRGFPKLGNIAEVRSLTHPLGKPVPDIAERAATPKNALARFINDARRDVGERLAGSMKRAREFYIARIDSPDGPTFVTRLDVVLESDPFDTASIHTLEEIEAWLQAYRPEGVEQAEYCGVTVHTRDMERVIESDRARVNGLVLAGVFLILFALVRKFWLASYLLATVLLSYYATLGATAIFATLLYGKAFGQIEWRVPFFLFTILVAVGEDYNILMVTRAFEERKRYGVIEGLRRGLARTGGTITACGIIMAGTFGTLVLGNLSTLVQVGFALGLGVLVDTFLVRPFLVPAFMLIVWRDELAKQPPAEKGMRRAA